MEWEGTEKLGVGTQGGKGGTAKVQSERAETAQEEGQGRRAMGTADEPQGAPRVPRQRRGSLTWSPHAGVNHAARPAGLGEQLCHLRTLYGGQALSAGSHPGRKPQGPPPSERKIPLPEGPPQQAGPQIMCVCWKSGGAGQRTSRLEELTPTVVPRKGDCLRQLPHTPCRLHWGKHI